MSRWRHHGKWGTWVEAKINAPELVKGKKVEGKVYMSSVSDAYQPIEKELKLTRRILENLDRNTRLSIQTKSDLVLRDIDLFKKFKYIEVGLTINGFDGRIKHLFEPCSSTHSQRVKALKILKENGISTYVFISPIIPGLVDVESVVNETKPFSDYFWFEVLNLRGAGKEFSSLFKNNFPRSYGVMTDKELFFSFLNELKKIIKKQDIKTSGIEVHSAKQKRIKI